ncbi:hypothetical protein ABVT39_001240 [Epinephelus coioides]
MELGTNVKEYQFIMERPVGAISSTSDFTLDPDLFPSNYELLQSLGEGGFGQVVQCFKKDTNETVAVKIMKYGSDHHDELMILNVFKEMKLEEFNIVKFIDAFRLTNDGVALAFEMLDMTLKDYIADHRNFTPMELCDIRSVVQQLAIALNTLKDIGLIHTDIKIDNIMLVDREEQPLRVKLIDFGLGLPTKWAEQDPEQWAPLQTKHFRAPEIFLGLPYSEAIDMWSAGVVMSFMMLADVVFGAIDDYDVMRWIVALLGVPPDHLLNAATKSQHYFITDASGHWRLKTPEEYWQSTTVPSGYDPLDFSSLDILEELPQDNLNRVGAEEKRECIALLKAMLQIDPNERITPIEVLTHPFITRGTLHQNFDTSERPETSSETQGVIHVRPTSRTCILTLEGEEELEPKASSSSPDGFYAWTAETLPPGVIMVRSAPPECRLWGIEGSGQSESCPLDCLENVSENPPVEPTPLSTEDVEQELSATASETPSVSQGVIHVRPTSRTCILTLEGEEELEPKASSSAPDGFHASTAETLPPGVIMVMPAPPECRLWGIEGSGQSESCPLDFLENVSENPPVEPTPLSTEDVEQELSATASDHTAPKKKKEKRKRNCFKRFLAWTKRTFCCCISTNEDD